MSEISDWNKAIVEEFRANAGKVGGYFEGAPMLLLHTKGAKSGRVRINPLVYLPDGDRIAVFGTKSGAPDDPDWYRNALANPDVTVEVGSETFSATATPADEPDRQRLWALQKKARPSMAEYETKTTRTFPVLLLERAQS